ncbi:MAG: CPBP family glutamic-type intramembrane protease [Micropruina sp.]
MSQPPSGEGEQPRQRPHDPFEPAAVPPRAWAGPQGTVPSGAGGWATAQPQPQPTGSHPWLPSGPPPKPSVLPAEPREYHEFLRTPKLRWWRPVLALLMGGALFFASSTVFGLIAMLYDLGTGRTTLEDYGSIDRVTMTPALFLANNLGLAACIPIAMLTQWACFGQRPRWLSSVVGRFRWRWFGECALWALPLLLIPVVLDVVLNGLDGLRVSPDTAFMVAAVLLTTPLQSAGEEYLLRGLGQRAVAAWLPRIAGLVVSTAVTAVVFMLLHNAGDPWLNAFYLFFAVVGSVLAWRTGGLEAAVAVHAVNNMVSMIVLPFIDFSDMFNRGAGTGSPFALVQMAILASICAVLLWRARVRGLVVRNAPAAAAAASPMPVVWRQDHGNQAG